MTPAERAGYGRLFWQQHPGPDGKLFGGDAADVLCASGLPRPTLAKIWSLVDRDDDGFVTESEFAVAAHLMRMQINGMSLPHALPPDLEAAANSDQCMKKLRRSSSTASDASASAAAPSPSSPSGGLSEDEAMLAQAQFEELASASLGGVSEAGLGRLFASMGLSQAVCHEIFTAADKDVAQRLTRPQFNSALRHALQLSSLQEQINDLLEEQDATESTTELLAHQLSKTTANIDSLVAQRQQLQAHLPSSAGAASAAQAASSSPAALAEAMAAAQAEREALSQTVKDLAAEKKKVDRAHKQRLEELQAAHLQIKTLQKMRARLEEQIATLENMLAEARDTPPAGRTSASAAPAAAPAASASSPSPSPASPAASSSSPFSSADAAPPKPAAARPVDLRASASNSFASPTILTVTSPTSPAALGNPFAMPATTPAPSTSSPTSAPGSSSSVFASTPAQASPPPSPSRVSDTVSLGSTPDGTPIPTPQSTPQASPRMPRRRRTNTQGSMGSITSETSAASAALAASNPFAMPPSSSASDAVSLDAASSNPFADPSQKKKKRQSVATLDEPHRVVRAVAMFAWKARKPTHLSFDKGEVITVRRQSDSWCAGELHGRVGWFPRSYVKVMSSSFSVPRPSVSDGLADSKGGAKDSAAAAAAPSTSSAGKPTSAAPAQFKAVYAYEASEPGELSFKAGDIITVTEQDGKWWTGSCAGRTGQFPGNYVKPI